MNGLQPRAGSRPLLNGGVPSTYEPHVDAYSPRPPRPSTLSPTAHPSHQPRPRSTSPSSSPPLPKYPTLTSRASPHSAAASLPPPAPPPPSSLLTLTPRRRRFILLVALSLVLFFPVAHFLSTSFSPFAQPSLCSPSSLSPAVVSEMNSLSLQSSAGSSRAAFLFPALTPALYVTAHPDPSASLSQQFAQWVYGPYLSLTQNVSYAYTPFLKLSSRWATFLGFGDGEVTEPDLLATFARSRVFVRNAGDSDAAQGGAAGREVADWLSERRKKVEHINKQWTEWQRKADKAPDLPPPHVEEPKGSYLDGYTTRHVDPGQPITTATVFRLYRIPVPSLMHACHPPLTRLLRQKYCAARVRSPLPMDLYDADRRAGHMIVALHIVCGDACFNANKTSPMASYAHTVQRVTATAAAHSMPPPAFHVFSAAPSNDSKGEWFEPLRALRVRLHLDHHSHAVFHHLVMADVLVAPALAASSTSWLVQLLHAGVVIGPSSPQHACVGEVGMYHKDTGAFDEESFAKLWSTLGGHRVQYGSIRDCAAIK